MALPAGFVLEQGSTLPPGFELEEGASALAPITVPPTTAPAPQVSTMERMFGAGSPIARTIKGAVVDPLLGVNQLLASSGLFGQDVKQGATQLVRDVESATQQGRARVGSQGFDPFQLVGNVISPVNRLVGTAQALQAPGIAAAATRSAGTGALLAATAPVDAPVEQFTEKKLEQVTLGAVLGPVLEGGVNALGAFAGLFKGLTAKGREEVMRDQLNTLVGPDRGRVIEALRDAKELVTGSRPTAADAIADIPSAVELAAAQRKLASQSGIAGKFAERTVENQAARVRAIDEIAGTEAQRTALSAERTEVTGPLRETALDRGDIVGVTLGNIDRQANQTVSNLIEQVKSTLPPLQQTSSAFKLRANEMLASSKETASAFKKAQVESLEKNGVYPLLASDITSQLDKAIKGTVSDQSKAVLQAVRDRVLSKADENGIIGSRDLYENVRKISNQDIAKLLGLGEQYASGGIPQQAANALTNAKKLIDASLDKSSDGLWSKYLNSYTDYSTRLNRMEVGEFLSKKLNTPLDKERAGAFATAVENAAGTIKTSTGIPRFAKLSDVLTAKEVGTVNNVLADLSRTSKADELARMVRNVEIGLPDVTQGQPDLLNRTLTLGKAAFKFLQRGNAEAFDKQMAEMMLDPAAMAQFMSFAIPKGRIAETTSAMMKLMSEPTRAAFTQVFLIPAAAKEAGAAPRLDLVVEPTIDPKGR